MGLRSWRHVLGGDLGHVEPVHLSVWVTRGDELDGCCLALAADLDQDHAAGSPHLTIKKQAWPGKNTYELDR